MAKEKINNTEKKDDKLRKIKKARTLAKKRKKKNLTKAEKDRLRTRKITVSILLVTLFLINIYIILSVFFRSSDFAVSLDYEKGKEASLIVYESLSDKTEKTYLRCEDIDFFSDISINSIPADIHNSGEGSHHGDYYMAYTFYVENIGEDPVNYWTTAKIEEQEKNVDNAVRFMVYRNDEERRVYAKPATSGAPEPGTIPFKDETTIMLEQRKAIQPGDIDKITVVVFLEGSDPQCINDIIGGEISMYMNLVEEHITKEETEEKS